MAKRKIRVAKAKNGLAKRVDDGARLAVVIKSNQEADKETKAAIAAEAVEMLEDNELSIRVEGKKAFALVSFKRKAKLDVTCPEFKRVSEAVDSTPDLVDGVVTKTVRATIRPDAMEKIRARLGADFDSLVTISTDYTIDPDGFEALLEDRSSQERVALGEALGLCVTLDRTASIKYEPKLAQ